ncbi:creatininase family protein [Thermosulfurimonas marina]|uniref:Creatininase family protein n=1 Tax=Thermosulfurimonas marina TaxID=2047767 RepID=A0A6H1WQU2_9BACT|nr:creatininase family protein [Thermosulfurimonas marina]QJA05553.1 creatininase family protein [Thermosulfurimonas marina]
MRMEELTYPEVEALSREGVPVILPLGSVEEHGPHLPLATDLYTAYRVAEMAARRVQALVAPPVYYGLCRSTAEHPGTISLRGETLRALVLDLLAGFFQHGFRAFLLLSGHAGGTHMAFIVDAAEEFLSRHPETALAVVSLLDLLRERAGDLLQTPGDSHAGEWETSLIQYFHPQLVRGSAPEEYPRFPRYRIVSSKRAFWPGGVWGDPGRASPEKGRLLAERLAEGLEYLLRELREEVRCAKG